MIVAWVAARTCDLIEFIELVGVIALGTLWLFGATSDEPTHLDNEDQLLANANESAQPKYDDVAPPVSMFVSERTLRASCSQDRDDDVPAEDKKDESSTIRNNKNKGVSSTATTTGEPSAALKNGESSTATQTGESSTATTTGESSTATKTGKSSTTAVNKDKSASIAANDKAHAVANTKVETMALNKDPIADTTALAVVHDFDGVKVGLKIDPSKVSTLPTTEQLCAQVAAAYEKLRRGIPLEKNAHMTVAPPPAAGAVEVAPKVAAPTTEVVEAPPTVDAPTADVAAAAEMATPAAETAVPATETAAPTPKVAEPAAPAPKIAELPAEAASEAAEPELDTAELTTPEVTAPVEATEPAPEVELPAEVELPTEVEALAPVVAEPVPEAPAPMAPVYLVLTPPTPQQEQDMTTEVMIDISMLLPPDIALPAADVDEMELLELEEVPPAAKTAEAVEKVEADEPVEHVEPAEIIDPETILEPLDDDEFAADDTEASSFDSLFDERDATVDQAEAGEPDTTVDNAEVGEPTNEDAASTSICPEMCDFFAAAEYANIKAAIKAKPSAVAEAMLSAPEVAGPSGNGSGNVDAEELQNLAAACQGGVHEVAPVDDAAVAAQDGAVVTNDEEFLMLPSRVVKMPPSPLRHLAWSRAALDTLAEESDDEEIENKEEKQVEEKEVEKKEDKEEKSLVVEEGDSAAVRAEYSLEFNAMLNDELKAIEREKAAARASNAQVAPAPIAEEDEVAATETTVDDENVAQEEAATAQFVIPTTIPAFTAEELKVLDDLIEELDLEDTWFVDDTKLELSLARDDDDEHVVDGDANGVEATDNSDVQEEVTGGEAQAQTEQAIAADGHQVQHAAKADADEEKPTAKVTPAEESAVEQAARGDDERADGDNNKSVEAVDHIDASAADASAADASAADASAADASAADASAADASAADTSMADTSMARSPNKKTLQRRANRKKAEAAAKAAKAANAEESAGEPAGVERPSKTAKRNTKRRQAKKGKKRAANAGDRAIEVATGETVQAIEEKVAAAEKEGAVEEETTGAAGADESTREDASANVEHEAVAEEKAAEVKDTEGAGKTLKLEDEPEVEQKQVVDNSEEDPEANGAPTNILELEVEPAPAPTLTIEIVEPSIVVDVVETSPSLSGSLTLAPSPTTPNLSDGESRPATPTLPNTPEPVELDVEAQLELETLRKAVTTSPGFGSLPLRPATVVPPWTPMVLEAEPIAGLREPARDKRRTKSASSARRPAKVESTPAPDDGVLMGIPIQRVRHNSTPRSAADKKAPAGNMVLTPLPIPFQEKVEVKKQAAAKAEAKKDAKGKATVAEKKKPAADDTSVKAGKTVKTVRTRRMSMPGTVQETAEAYLPLRIDWLKCELTDEMEDWPVVWKVEAMFSRRRARAAALAKR